MERREAKGGGEECGRRVLGGTCHTAASQRQNDNLAKAPEDKWGF